MSGRSDCPPRRRIADFCEYVLSRLPPPPQRLLEVGCGQGDLALALAEIGHEVTAIDPEAPEGPIFRRVRLEDLDELGPFDGVVASVSLHHIEDLAAAVDKIAEVLRPGGVVILEEFASERLSGTTAAWYYHQRRALAAIGREDAEVPDDFQTWRRQWANDHADLHPSTTMHTELRRRFHELNFAWTPYLYSYLLDDCLEAAERTLIETGEIEPTGFRYVGERKPTDTP